MAYRGEHYAAIGMGDDFRDLLISPGRIRQVQVGPKETNFNTV